MPGYMRACDVVVVPSLKEGLPNVCTEAAAGGKPVLGSDVGGIPEVVVDRETGFLLPPGHTGSWKAALIDCAGAPTVLVEMGQRARERIERLFDRNAFAPQMVDLYRAALAAYRRRHARECC